MTDKLKLISGLDIGNGYTKGLIRVFDNEPVNIDLPSGAAYVTSSHDVKLSDYQDIENTIGDIFNEMDVSFYSPIINDQIRRLFGRRGVKSGLSIEEFDVSSSLSKAQQNLSAVLVLGCFAGHALQNYWFANKNLPEETIQVDAYVALALPISEYKKHRFNYADGFKKAPHRVDFHNFERPVSIEINFIDVQVQAEGASAHYAILTRGEPLMNAMLGDVRQFDANILQGVSARDVLAAKNIIGVDIGEGTVNFPVFQEGKFSPDASFTFGQGYGTVLNQSLDRLSDEGYPFGSRKQLADFLQQTPSALSKTRYDRACQVVREESVAFSQELCRQFLRIMSKAGAYADVVYVYGGGASPLKDQLHRSLITTARNLGAGSEVPILYLDSRYSRHLNREGLYAIANAVATRLISQSYQNNDYQEHQE